MFQVHYSDTHRFDQTGYSAPTRFPQPHHYTDLDLFLEDMIHAVEREKSHRCWTEEERIEHDLEARMERAELLNDDI